MRQIEILHVPRGLVFVRVPFALAEKDQFETEPFAPLIRHIARVIPPFGAKIFVFEMIAGKLVTIAGERLAIRETGRYEGHRHEHSQQ